MVCGTNRALLVLNITSNVMKNLLEKRIRNMTRINPITETQATGHTKELYTAVNKKLGLVPNMVKTMAVSTPVLESYLAFSGTAGNTLNAQERELIALAVAEVNGCEYCTAAHSTIGKMVGLSPEAIQTARRGTGTNARQQAIIELAVAIADERGNISDSQLQKAREAGLTDAEILEVTTNVVLNFFTNFVNNVAETEVDFPKAEPLEQAAV